MKRGKEIKINTPYGYNVVGGTVDNKNPQSIYIQISAWGEPKEYDDEMDFNKIIKQKDKRVRKKLLELVDTNQFHTSKSIVDFSMAASGISKNKRSFMSVEVTLFQKNLTPINSKEMEPHINSISKGIIDDVLNHDEHFKFHRKKSN